MTPVSPSTGARSGARRPRRRWEDSLLGALAYPANLAFAGVATLILSLGVVTTLPACIASARALSGWLRHGDTAVFTSIFRQFARTWRRSLPLGVASALVVAVLVVDIVFLSAQLSGGTPLVALLMTAATVPIAIAVSLILLAIPVAATRSPEAGPKQWMIEAGYLVARRPGRAIFLLALVIALALTFYLLPTLAPFFGLSLPVYLALVSLGDSQRAEKT
jgi:uncharacterized membrane protein YesL